MKATSSPRAKKALFASLIATVVILMSASPAPAQTVLQDSFTGTQPQLDWLAYGNACMTAGNGTANSAGGQIPACTQITDTAGSGALRLTDALNNEAGAIVDQQAYSTASGLQVTFTTYTYGGNSGGAAGDGADGIGFYLLQSISPTGTPGGTNPYQLGAFGGSLAYSCSNVNNSGGNSSIGIPANHYNGMPNGYLGLGIDEYGNFLNAGDNTGTGALANATWGSSTSGAIASGSGPEYQPQRIGLRAWGNVTKTALLAVNSSASDSDVQSTCQNNGLYTNGPTYSSTSSNGGNTATVTNYTYTQSSSAVSYTYSSGGYGGYGGNGGTTTYATVTTTTYGSSSVTSTSTSPSNATLYSSSSCKTTYSGSGSAYGEVSQGGFGGSTCTKLTASTSTSSTTQTYATSTTYNATSGAPSNLSPSATLYGTSSCSSSSTYSSGTAYGSVNNGNSCTSLTATSTNYPWFPDYTTVAGGSVILPYSSSGTNNPIANESASVRTSATPIAYKLTITPSPNSMLSLQYSYNGGSYQTILPPTAITTSNPTLPTNLYFGFGGSTGGSNNVHEITCFQVTPSDQSASSAGVNVEQAGSVQTGTQVYLASYHTNNWWGELTSQNIVINGTTVSISPTYNWDASCYLTGGNCATTGVNSMSPQAQSTRNLLTWNDSSLAGKQLTWSNLSSNEQTALNAGDTNGSNRLSFLTGIRTDEVPTSTGVATGAQVFRDRTSILGDIIDSSPTWVGPPNAPYTATWSDLLYPSNPASENTGTQTYPQFITAEATRLNVVYDGANDGFMHGFEAGSYNTDGSFNSTNNDGAEVLGYMPASVLYSIHSTTATADYSSPNYSHEYYTDATPGTGDLFYNSVWHTWLVSGLGAGGKAIFALDITTPGNFSGNTGGAVIGEWDASSLTCYLGTTANTNCGGYMGQTFGTPEIRRLHNGEWGIIFGNGFNSANGHAGIFVLTITNTGVEDKLYYLDTGVGTSSNPNGIAYVTATDMDGDHISDYVYAGDYYGNIWRFDLTSSTASSWAVSDFGNTTTATKTTPSAPIPTPLFTTPSITTTFTTNSSGTTTSTTPVYNTLTTTQQQTQSYGSTSTKSNGTTTTTTVTSQPITTQVVVVAVTPTTNGLPRVMVEFGTGDVAAQSISSSIQYGGGQQTIYGVWDWDVGQTAPTTGYAGLIGSSSAPGSSSSSTTIINYSQLEAQTITNQTSATNSGTGQGYRTLSSNAICFAGTSCTTTSGTTTTTSAGTQFGWLLNLPGYNGLPSPGVGGTNQTEQVIYSPVETEGAFIVNTVVPANNSPTSCTVQSALGWTMALNPGTGGALPESFFANSSGQFVTLDNASVGGIALNATGSPSVVTANNLPYLVSQTSTGAGTINPINPPNGGKTLRLTWQQIH
jgi:type IV pilus assembly protein PilY1